MLLPLKSKVVILKEKNKQKGFLVWTSIIQM